MSPVSIPAVMAQEVPHAAILVMACVVTGIFVRVVLSVLAALVVCRAIANAAEHTEAARDQHLAVLHAILTALTHQSPSGHSRDRHTRDK